MFTTTPIPAFHDNYIWMLQIPDSDRVAVVDPGDASPVIHALERHQLKLDSILITHHHADHTGGVEQLRQAYNPAVYGPARSPFQGITHRLEEGDRCQVLGQSLQVKAVPGHTLDHISYYLEGRPPQLFCGDTLFLAGCGRLFEGSPAQMLDAMDYFAQLPDTTEVYSAHEYSLANLAFAQAVEPNNPLIEQAIERCRELRQQQQPTLPSTISRERAVNPFMRTDQPSVQRAANAREAVAGDDRQAVFRIIREWKNNF